VGEQPAPRWLALLTAVAVAALVVDFRARIAVATGVMLFLGLARQHGFLNTLPVPAAVAHLSRISYSVFLVHFPLCLLVNMLVSAFPANPVINAMGMVLAVVVSVVGGHQFHYRVESYPFRTRTRLLFPAGVVAGAG
jgi:peptidoglycan/LPS O-acetylase OafA/YrhL